MHFKVTSPEHLSAKGTCWGRIWASNDASRSPPLSVSPLSFRHLREISPPPPLPSAGFRRRITFTGTHCMEIRIQREMTKCRRPRVHLSAESAGRAAGMETNGARSPHPHPHPTAWLIYKLWPFSPSFHCHWRKIRWARLLQTSNILQSIHQTHFLCSLLCGELSGCIHWQEKKENTVSNLSLTL